MVSGHLAQKKGHWYIVLNLKKEGGKKGPKWFSTGLKTKGNKKKAEELLIELRRQFTAMEISKIDAVRLPFSEYLEIWLAGMKAQVEASTFAAYRSMTTNTVIPYFEQLGVALCAVKPIHIETLYHSMLESNLSANTVLRHHALLHKALGDAMRKELIPRNPADLAWRPSKCAFITEPYSVEELSRLFEVLKGHRLEVLLKLTAFYGLRRSEVLGLKWKVIDFQNGTITINHTVQHIRDEGVSDYVYRDKVKRKSSFRTLPMPVEIQEILMDYRKKQYANRPPKPEVYIFIDEKGDVIKPNYVSYAFPKFLKANSLRHIRLHDLRHSSAGVLISNRVPLIEVQQWLGHSTIGITADLYSHLEYAVKENSAAIMSEKLFKEVLKDEDD